MHSREPEAAYPQPLAGLAFIWSASDNNPGSRESHICRALSRALADDRRHDDPAAVTTMKGVPPTTIVPVLAPVNWRERLFDWNFSEGAAFSPGGVCCERTAGGCSRNASDCNQRDDVDGGNEVLRLVHGFFLSVGLADAACFGKATYRDSLPSASSTQRRRRSPPTGGQCVNSVCPLSISIVTSFRTQNASALFVARVAWRATLRKLERTACGETRRQSPQSSAPAWSQGVSPFARRHNPPSKARCGRRLLRRKVRALRHLGC